MLPMSELPLKEGGPRMLLISSLYKPVDLETLSRLISSSFPSKLHVTVVIESTFGSQPSLWLDVGETKPISFAGNVILILSPSRVSIAVYHVTMRPSTAPFSAEVGSREKVVNFYSLSMSR